MSGRDFPDWPFPDKGRELGRRQLARSMRMVRLLEEVDAAFQAVGLRYLCYKGPAVSSLAFGEPWLRQSNDLDLWLERDDIRTGCEALFGIGFVATRTVPPLATHLEFAYEYALYNKEWDVTIELHWELVPHRYSGRLAFNHTYQSKIGVLWRTIYLPVPSVEVNLVLLAVHGSKHLWYRLIWLYDLAGILARRPPDWVLVEQIARDARARRKVSVALLLLNRVLNVPLPTTWRFSKPEQILANSLISWIRCPPSKAKGYVALLLLEDGLTGAARSVASLLFHPTIADLTWPRRAPRWNWLYYLIRPLRCAYQLLSSPSSRSKT